MIFIKNFVYDLLGEREERKREKEGGEREGREI